MDTELGIPNLDDCSSEDRLAYAQVFSDLSAYCHLKVRAERSRLAGNTTDAIDAECGAEYLYRALPEWARW